MATKIVSVTTTTCDICQTVAHRSGYGVETGVGYIKFGNTRYYDLCKPCATVIQKFIKKELLKPKKK